MIERQHREKYLRVKNADDAHLSSSKCNCRWVLLLQGGGVTLDQFFFFRNHRRFCRAPTRRHVGGTYDHVFVKPLLGHSASEIWAGENIMMRPLPLAAGVTPPNPSLCTPPYPPLPLSLVTDSSEKLGRVVPNVPVRPLGARRGMHSHTPKRR